MAAWWFNNSGLNLLKGDADDPANPIRLPAESIIHFLRSIPAARASFNDIVPTMLPAEQTRLRAIAEGSAKFMYADYKKVEDDFQASQNKAGVHAGRRGGQRIGGN